MTYLSQAYLTVVLSNYSPNTGKNLRKNKTLYILDNGIANAILRLPDVTDTTAGYLVESVCVRTALAVCEEQLWSLHYWRDKQNEVDLLIDRKTDLLPIEVKYRNTAQQTSLAAFRKSSPGQKIPLSIVITKEELKRSGDVLYVPFWMIR